MMESRITVIEINMTLPDELLEPFPSKPKDQDENNKRDEEYISFLLKKLGGERL